MDARVLDVDGTPPPSARSRDLDAGVFAPGPDDQLVTLDLLPRSRWVVDYYPVDSVEERADGVLRVRLRTADTAWLRQLVLRLGGGGRVVDPPALAQAVTVVAREALDAYEVGAEQG
jgi:proteasome accessory factor C